MSPDAQEVLSRLLGEVEATRTVALGRAAALNAVDAAAVFEALGSRARQTEGSSVASNSPLPLMCQWVDKRPELFGELMTFLKSLSPAAVPFSLPPRLTQLATASPDRKPQLIALMKGWESSTNARLKAAAQQQLVKLAK